MLYALHRANLQNYYLQYFPNVTTKKSEITGGYTAIVSDNTECEAINKYAFLNESNLSKQDDNYDYDKGLHDFKITCSTPGQTIKVTIIWDKEYDTSTWTYRKYNSNTKEYKDISSLVTYQTQTIAGNKHTTTSYQVQDGGPLDQDGIANGTIEDPAGPAVKIQKSNLAKTGQNTLIISLVSTLLLSASALTIKLKKKMEAQ